MEDKKQRAAYYDAHEQELQLSGEIQDYSDRLLELMSNDESASGRSRLGRSAGKQGSQVVVTQPNTSEEDQDLDLMELASPNGTMVQPSESGGAPQGQPGAFHVSQGSATSASVATTEDGDSSQKEGVRPEQVQIQEDQCHEHAIYGVEALTSLPPRVEDQTERNRLASVHSMLASFSPVVAVRVNPDDAEQRARQKILDEAIQADVVSQECPLDETNHRSRRILSIKCLVIGLGVTFLAILGLIVGLSVGLTRNGPGNASKDDGKQDDPSSSLPPGPSEPSLPSLLSKPTLQTVRDRGLIRCGLPDVFYHIQFDPDTEERAGFEVDMCRGFAAGIFGDQSKFEIVDVPLHERFTALADESIDLYFGATQTMGRDLREASSDVGFAFTVPFLYGGIAFGGKDFFVQCVDDLNTRGECSALRVCAAPGTAQSEIVEVILPPSHILQLPAEDIYVAFEEGRCNVIISEIWDLAMALIQQDTFGTDHSVGKALTHESISIVTRDDDPGWSDLVNWMLQSLFEAEKQGITQDSAGDFKSTSMFGEEYKDMFKNVIGAAGNYGEIYDRHLASALPRSGMNLINTNHTSGILRIPAVDGVSDNGREPFRGGDLDRIARKGYLVCGITGTQPGFAEFDSSTSVWSGLDVDYCLAVASSIFSDSFTNETVRYVEFEDVKVAFEALADGSVDVLCGQRVTLGADVSGYGSREGATFSLPYFYNNEGGDNRALAVRQTDPQWSSFVFWTVACTIYAEVENITQQTSNGMPEVMLFGSLYRRMFRDAILAVGNYGEMYGRNLESLIPRSGLNLLNIDEPVGPQQHLLPFDESPQ